MIRVVSLVALVAFQVGRAGACDYTVRDIGFVPFNDARYTLRIRCAASAPVPENLEAWLSSRRVRQQWIQSENDLEEMTWSIELIDAGGRNLPIANSVNDDEFPSLDDLLEELFETPRLQELRQKTTASFAQIIFIAGTEDAARDVAVEASGAMKQLEPMLPRPVNLPIHVLDLAPEERSRERLLLWCLGLDNLSEKQSAISVVYGRGRLAGPLLTGEDLTLENTLRQLALVGESCECDTSRDWTLLPEVPLLWDARDSQQAKLALGFDPTSEATLADVQDVLSRGRRGSAFGRRADRLDQIVTGYFEGAITETEPKLLAIPPGRNSPPPGGNSPRDSEVATVIQGDGWGFDEESVEPAPSPDLTKETDDLLERERIKESATKSDRDGAAGRSLSGTGDGSQPQRGTFGTRAAYGIAVIVTAIGLTAWLLVRRKLSAN